VHGSTAYGYTVTFDAEGIGVPCPDKTGPGARTQVIPWRDVSALSKTEDTDAFNFYFLLKKHAVVYPRLPLTTTARKCRGSTNSSSGGYQQLREAAHVVEHNGGWSLQP
jgi:hypothetical protein